MSNYTVDNTGIVNALVVPNTANAQDVILYMTRNGLIPSADLTEQLILLAPQIKSQVFPEFKQFLDSILCSSRAEHGLGLLEKTHWLSMLLPEIISLHNVTQPPEYHPEGDVWVHTMLMLHHSCQPPPVIAWAILLHDIGKPMTRSVESSGRIRFFGHECVGAKIAEKILRRFEFNENDIQKITRAIRNHMRFGNIMKMRKEKVIKLTQDDNFPIELELHRLDCYSSHRRFECYLRALEVWMEEQYLREQQISKPTHQSILNGHDLILLGFKQGKQLGEILKRINNLFINGEITSREQALNYAKNIFNAQKYPDKSN